MSRNRSKSNRPSGSRLAPLLALLLASLLLLAACAGQPQTSNLPGSLNVTSATQVTSLNYVLTGTFEFPDAEGGTLEYSLNDGAWQQVDLRAGNAFTITLTLREGQNKIAMALTTTAGVRTQDELVVTATVSTPGEPDEVSPQFILTSTTLSLSPDYRLAGAVLDNVGVDSVSYSLNDADLTELHPDSLGFFAADLELVRGPNVIRLAAIDAAGNEGEAEFEVTFVAQIEGVDVSPMVAAAGETITISGSHFGAVAGTVTLGDVETVIDRWTDSEITAVVPEGSTGWLDLHIAGVESEYTVPYFFAGIEVQDSTELADWLLNPDAAGTSLLLSGANYVIGSDNESLAVFAGAVSLHGSRTEGSPTTVLSVDSNGAYLGTSREFGIKFQDLRIEAQGVVFLNYPEPPNPGIMTSFLPGLTLENIEFTSRFPEVNQTVFSVGMAGQTEYYPVQLRMSEVHVTGVQNVALESRQIQIQDSSFEFGTAMNVQSYDGPQRISNTRILGAESGDNPVINLWSYDSVFVEESSLSASAIVMQARLEGTYHDNNIATGTLRLAGPGEMTVDLNRITLSGGLHIHSADVTLADNEIDLVEGLSVYTDGLVTITGNDFRLANYTPDTYAFNFRPQSTVLELEFSQNSSSGINRLLRFNGQGGTLDAEIIGNTFTANLQTVGDVAVLDTVTTAGAITTSGNVWGALESAQDVLSLIRHMGGSHPGAMTVADF